MNKYFIIIYILVFFNSFYGQNNTIEEKYINNKEVFNVSNVYEFLNAIGSNRIIYVEESIHLPNIVLFDSIIKSSKNEHWSNLAYDNINFVLSFNDLINLKIIGKSEAPIQITTCADCGNTLSFINCQNILIENIEAGHLPRNKNYCSGGVFYFAHCKNITINSCIMFGSGNWGIMTYEVSNLYCNNSTIENCNMLIMDILNSNQIDFSNCTFKNNKGFTGIDLTSSLYVYFNNCIFKGNNFEGYDFILSSGKDCNSLYENCSFINNKARAFSEDTIITLKCEFKNNKFKLKPNNFKIENYFSTSKKGNLTTYEIDQIVKYNNLKIQLRNNNENIIVKPYNYNYDGSYINKYYNEDSFDEDGNLSIGGYDTGTDSCKYYILTNRKNKNGALLEDLLYRIDVYSIRIKHCGYGYPAEGEPELLTHVDNFFNSWVLDENQELIFHEEMHVNSCCIPSCTEDYGGNMEFYYKSNIIYDSYTDGELMLNDKFPESYLEYIDIFSDAWVFHCEQNIFIDKENLNVIPLFINRFKESEKGNK